MTFQYSVSICAAEGAAPCLHHTVIHPWVTHTHTHTHLSGSKVCHCWTHSLTRYYDLQRKLKHQPPHTINTSTVMCVCIGLRKGAHEEPLIIWNNQLHLQSLCDIWWCIYLHLCHCPSASTKSWWWINGFVGCSRSTRMFLPQPFP